MMSAAHLPMLPCPPEAIDDFLSEPGPEATALLGRTAGPILVLGAGGKMGLHLSLMLRKALAPLGRAGDVRAVSRFSTLRDREDFVRHGITTLAVAQRAESGDCPHVAGPAKWGERLAQH